MRALHLRARRSPRKPEAQGACRVRVSCVRHKRTKQHEKFIDPSTSTPNLKLRTCRNEPSSPELSPRDSPTSQNGECAQRKNATFGKGSSEDGVALQVPVRWMSSPPVGFRANTREHDATGTVEHTMPPAGVPSETSAESRVLETLQRWENAKLNRKVKVANKQLIAQPARTTVLEAALLRPQERAPDILQLASSALEARVKWETEKMRRQRDTPRRKSSARVTRHSEAGWSAAVSANEAPVMRAQLKWLLSVEQAQAAEEESSMAV